MLKEEMITLARRAGIISISDKCWTTLNEDYKNKLMILCSLAEEISDGKMIIEKDIHKAIEIMGYNIARIKE